MAEKTKLQLQIEASAKKIQEELRRLKQLEKQQAERDRKARNHRLCKRHGFIEKMLPDIIDLTDEQYESFVNNHIANRHGIAALAKLTGHTAETATGAPTCVKHQNNGSIVNTSTSGSSGKSANSQATTA